MQVKLRCVKWRRGEWSACEVEACEMEACEVCVGRVCVWVGRGGKENWGEGVRAEGRALQGVCGRVGLRAGGAAGGWGTRTRIDS